ncbi:universal stress protein [Arthrobacter sp. AL08]|uniref:universal stress protein n=1 Tax=Micrococcaceae TaxID=1268 RepID=UPI00249C24C5|nr:MULTISPECIES: universal stress protein [Micrococcaceae]MDI3242282.1 universal stress protein [Arthrobacter sp. AL05]MDI3278292.1 universal stress protein [Arthrobacter sp. AL08]MDJ0351566.1 universal stress protein [Pseudarthrobacter sp. PH31-O2]
MDDSGSFRIVVGVDGSPQSKAAMDWAIVEAKLRNGQVLALAAWNFPYVGDALGQVWDYDVFQSDAEAILKAELARVTDQGVNITGRAVQANPGSALVEASRAADLVVVGSRGHGGFTGMMLGSVSAATVHHAHCPVLVLRERSTE